MSTEKRDRGTYQRDYHRARYADPVTRAKIKAEALARYHAKRAAGWVQPKKTAPVKPRRQCETCGDFFSGAGRYCSNSCRDY